MSELPIFPSTCCVFLSSLPLCGTFRSSYGLLLKHKQYSSQTNKYGNINVAHINAFLKYKTYKTLLYLQKFIGNRAASGSRKIMTMFISQFIISRPKLFNLPDNIFSGKSFLWRQSLFSLWPVNKRNASLQVLFTKKNKEKNS